MTTESPAVNFRVSGIWEKYFISITEKSGPPAKTASRDSYVFEGFDEFEICKSVSTAKYSRVKPIEG